EVQTSNGANACTFAIRLLISPDDGGSISNETAVWRTMGSKIAAIAGASSTGAKRMVPGSVMLTGSDDRPTWNPSAQEHLEQLGHRVEVIHMIRRRVAGIAHQREGARDDLARLLHAARPPLQYRRPFQAEPFDQPVRRFCR